MSKIILLIMLIITSACNPFKVTDPYDPKFNVNKFRFDDYGDKQSLNDVLKKYLPVGTNMASVDKMLVESGGASKRKAAPNNYSYYRSPSFIKSISTLYAVYGWSVDVEYDQNQTVQKIKVISQ